MRSFLRIALNTATALSLLLAVATGVLWVRSRIINDDAWFYYSRDSSTRTYTDTGILSQAGILDIYSCSRSIDTQEGFDNDDGLLSPRGYREGLNYRRYPVGSGGRGGGSFWWRYGFKFEAPRWHSIPQGYHPGRYTFASFSAPHSFLVLLSSMLPALWLLRRYLYFRRHRRGLCACCGYDLRASPNQCPECGTSRQPTTTPAV